VVELFIADSPQHLEKLASAIASGEPELLANKAHRYLSSIENLGARRMRTHCMELERIGRAGSVVGAEAALAALRDEYVLARRNCLPSSPTPAPPPAEPAAQLPTTLVPCIPLP
jgi:two-component system sensor histidine kinase/response regulator